MSNSKTKVIALFSAVILMLSGCNNADENIAAKTSALLEQTTALTENTEAVMDTKVQLSDFATQICNDCYFLEDTALSIQNLIALSDSKFVFLYSELTAAIRLAPLSLTGKEYSSVFSSSLL